MWMDSTRWQTEPLDWATSLYGLLVPRVNVRGRMALILFLAVVWALGWLAIRTYAVIKTPNDVLVDKLGLDIPPPPALTLEEISAREIQIAWKYVDPQSSVQAHLVEVNGKVIGQTKKAEVTATIHNLLPGTLYDIRVFSESAARFQTPSALLHVRTSPSSSASSQEDSNDGTPFIRAYASKSTTSQAPLAAALMAREHSGGQPLARRGTTGRRVSPVYYGQDGNAGDETSRAAGGEVDGNLAQLSQRFQKSQLDMEALEGQMLEEEKEFEVAIRDLEKRRDELKQSLKERDEASSDLKKQVHKMETARGTAQSERSKKERLLHQKESSRKKRRDEIARWEDQVSSMKEEMAGIETQKAAIERRTLSEIREIRHKIEEEQREVSLLDEENKEKALQIKALEEERQQLNGEEETDETREDDRLEREKDIRWRHKLDSLGNTYGNLYHHLDMAKQQYQMGVERLKYLESARRQPAVSWAPITPLDMEAVRRGVKPIRRTRNGSSLTSSISSPRAAFTNDIYAQSQTFAAATNASPTASGPTLFNPTNGMTFAPPESPNLVEEDLDTPEGPTMSPRADSLLPADLLGDESADEMAGGDLGMPYEAKESSGQFPTMRPTSIREERNLPGSPSPVSSSSRSFSSPRESFTNMYDPDRRSIHSGQPSTDMTSTGEDGRPTSRKLMYNLFSFSRQRGKTLADQPPLLGTLKAGQSQSFPRNFGEDLDADSQRRRRQSYGGNWAFPGNFLPRGSAGSVDKAEAPARPSATRRAFPGLFGGLGKSSDPTPVYDPFAPRTSTFDPDIRIDGSASRPSSMYSFDALPRPSMESQFRAWGPERSSALRGSPLAPDWASSHSFSRSQSRRPSIHHGSTSNLSLGAQADSDFLEGDSEAQRPLQAPIGTRPLSSQRPLTPKLNPAAPSFTTLFSKRAEKKDKSKSKDPGKDKPLDMVEDTSPPDSRKSKDTQSIAATGSTIESGESLERSVSAQSIGTPVEMTPQKPTFISKITRKASSNKFGSWKEKGGIFSRKEASTPSQDMDEGDAASANDQLGKSLESTSTTPSGEDRKASRTSLSWSFIRSKSKKGVMRDDLATSEVSESSERASEVGEGDEGDHYER